MNFLGVRRQGWLIALAAAIALAVPFPAYFAWSIYRAVHDDPTPKPDPSSFESEFDRNPPDHPWAGAYREGPILLRLTPTRWSRFVQIGDVLDTWSSPLPVVAAGDHLRLTGSSDRQDRFMNDLVVVRWSDRVYLVPESHLGEFTWAVNAGVEPRKRSTEFDWQTGFLRDGDELKPVQGRPGLPASFLSKLVGHEIAAKVVRAEKASPKEGEFTWIKLDAGRRQGVFPGTRFFPKGKGSVGDARVVAVSENAALATYVAFGKSSAARVGWTMATTPPDRSLELRP